MWHAPCKLTAPDTYTGVVSGLVFVNHNCFALMHACLLTAPCCCCCCCCCVCEYVQVEGRGQGDPLLAALGSSLVQYGINVNSAAQENDDGQVFSVFKVTTKEGKQVPKVCVPARVAGAMLSSGGCGFVACMVLYIPGMWC